MQRELFAQLQQSLNSVLSPAGYEESSGYLDGPFGSHAVEFSRDNRQSYLTVVWDGRENQLGLGGSIEFAAICARWRRNKLSSFPTLAVAHDSYREAFNAIVVELRDHPAIRNKMGPQQSTF